MTTRVDTLGPLPEIRGSRSALRRAALLMLAPVLVYALARPAVGSDALALAIGGAIPVIYSIVLAVARRHIDPVALLSAIGFSLACLVSALAGGSSLPLKLDEAAVTFTLGVVLLVAVLIRHPLPIAKPLRIPSPTRAIESALGVMIGGFLILHALLHLVLAVSLSTSSYLIVSRVVNWGTIAAGVLALSLYVHRLRSRTVDTGELNEPSAPAGGQR